MTKAPGKTIFALSTGSPPAAIAIVRISGPDANAALRQLAGSLPPPRRAKLFTLYDPVTRDALDRALVLRFAGPASATGEDVVELHLHGGRAVVAGLLSALGAIDGLRLAEPGEFTRRAFDNGRLDLVEAEGLGDLLAAETQSQRRAALALSGGSLSRQIEDWQARLLALAAQVEAVLDFADESEVGAGRPAEWGASLAELAGEMESALDRRPAERLRDGVRVVVAGPPNSGKSSLFNAIAQREAAIVTSIAGTTRDLVEAPIALAGIPFVLIDTAGLRESNDTVEAIGIARTWQSLVSADLALWLGDPGDCPDPDKSILICSKADLRPADRTSEGVAVSAVTGAGIEELIAVIVRRASSLLPGEGEASLNARHREILREAVGALRDEAAGDLVLLAEQLRYARSCLDRITGRAGVEDMMDVIFKRFCLGK